MTSTIITVATMKGGSGKSTVASCLAVYWHINGRRPVLIDADPQRSIMRIAERDRALGGVAIVEDFDTGGLGDRAAAQSQRQYADHRHARIPLDNNAGLSGGLGFHPRPRQGIAARCRPHA